MASGYPDFTRAVALIGRDPDGNLILIGVDADGRLTVPFKGENPSGDLATVAVDADGQLYAIMRGASGEDVLVDTDGFMSAVLKGERPNQSLTNIALDAKGQMISIMKGASGNNLDVDASGFMTAILKGISGGVLKTIGLDDDGRISGYLVDDEDQWGEILRVGNAEQAARLGSVVSWDRRGQVQHVCDFGKGLHGLQAAPDGWGSTVTLDPVYWQSGGYSVRLHTVAHTFCQAYLGGRVGPAPSAKYGLSVTWASADSPDFLYLGIKHYNGTTMQEGRLKFDDGAKELSYRDSDGNYQKIADLELSASVYTWHNMKLVVDFDTGLYVRAMVNSVEHTLGHDVKATTVPDGPEHLLYRFHVDGYDAITSDTYLDNMIFTVNEP